MANNFLLLSTIGAIGWIFLSEPPEMKPVREPSRVAAADAPASSYVGASPSSEIKARQAPVPLVRRVQVPPAATAATAPAVSVETPVATGEQDDLDRRAAKAAAEEDGYKRVTIIGRASNGAWRVRGLRGTTEVLLTVDGTGRVSMD